MSHSIHSANNRENLEWTYCTNVHPLNTLENWKKAVSFFGKEVKQHLGWEKMPLGMWFNDSVAQEILSNASTWDEEKKCIQTHLGFLEESGISTFTLNAFPFGNFHQKVVKTEVYKPDWTESARLEYTIRCARILSHLMGKRSFGTLSTVPLGWKQGWTEEKTKKSAKQLVDCVRQLYTLNEERGKVLQVCIEAEPGCVIETTDETLAFWDRFLRPMAQQAGISEEVLARHCGVCYDTCHQAVQFEDAVDALKKLQDAGISVGKMQLSNALEFLPEGEGKTERGLKMRELFVEERFLHQTRICDLEAGEVVRYNDLPEALNAAHAAQGNLDFWKCPWRVHYHVPLFAQDMLQKDPSNVGLGTTVEEMKKAFGYALEQGLCRHFEVETYTWTVLPEAWRPSNDGELAENIAKEIRMVEEMVRRE